MDWVITLFKKALLQRFTGTMQINFKNGIVININLHENVMPPKNERTDRQ